MIPCRWTGPQSQRRMILMCSIERIGSETLVGQNWSDGFSFGRLRFTDSAVWYWLERCRRGLWFFFVGFRERVPWLLTGSFDLRLGTGKLTMDVRSSMHKIDDNIAQLDSIQSHDRLRIGKSYFQGIVILTRSVESQGTSASFLSQVVHLKRSLHDCSRCRGAS
jgi:hypothetical protein